MTKKNQVIGKNNREFWLPLMAFYYSLKLWYLLVLQSLPLFIHWFHLRHLKLNVNCFTPYIVWIIINNTYIIKTSSIWKNGNKICINSLFTIPYNVNLLNDSTLSKAMWPHFNKYDPWAKKVKDIHAHFWKICSLSKKKKVRRH